MKISELKNLIVESYQEVVNEVTSIIENTKNRSKQNNKKQLDQTKDGKITAGDAVVAARKAKIAASKKDKSGEEMYTKIKKTINKHIVKEKKGASDDHTKQLKGAKVIMVTEKGNKIYLKLSKNDKVYDARLC